jgi:ElaB/YqjD/DUF883 family membrane-anchored ribosome-binding protein
MKRLDESDIGGRMRMIESEADARRTRLSGNLDELSDRLTVSNLLAEGKEAIWREVDRVTDSVLKTGEELLAGGLEWTRDNRKLVVGGTATALLTAAAVWYATRRRTVPLYAAYNMEDPEMMTETDDTLKARASGAWDKVRGEARHAGDKAGEAYYAARSKANELSDVTRERAAHAAVVARERAAEAAEAAAEARKWAVKQPQENPAAVILSAIAFGALVGLLLPSGSRDRA